MTSRLMAPHWQAYFKMTAPDSLSGRNVSPTEVRRDIDQEQLKRDPAYRAAITKLLDTSDASQPHVTPRAAAPLEALLAATRPNVEARAKILETPSYSPGVGIVPAERDPNVIYGPHVNLKVQFSEAKAKPVTSVENDHTARMVNIHGRRVEVAGTLTVFIHGEADKHSNARPKPQDLDVHAPLIAQGFGGGAGKYLLVIRDGREAGTGGVLKQTTFDISPMPMLPHRPN